MGKLFGVVLILLSISIFADDFMMPEDVEKYLADKDYEIIMKDVKPNTYFADFISDFTVVKNQNTGKYELKTYTVDTDITKEIQKGNEFLNGKNYKGAISNYKYALKKGTKYNILYNKIALSYFLLKDYDKATEYAVVGTNQNHSNFYLYNLLGKIAMKKKDPFFALEYLLKSLVNNPNNKETIQLLNSVLKEDKKIYNDYIFNPSISYEIKDSKVKVSIDRGLPEYWKAYINVHLKYYFEKPDLDIFNYKNFNCEYEALWNLIIAYAAEDHKKDPEVEKIITMNETGFLNSFIYLNIIGRRDIPTLLTLNDVEKNLILNMIKKYFIKEMGVKNEN